MTTAAPVNCEDLRQMHPVYLKERSLKEQIEQ